MAAPRRRRLPLLTCRRREDAGAALVTTMIAMTVMVTLSLVLLDRALSSQGVAREDQDWNAALAAAQAGVDDYVHRLNDSNGSYYIYNTANPDSANSAMGPVSGSWHWAPVPQAKATDAQRGWFHYDINTDAYTGTSSVTANGTLVITSTGKVGTKRRTVKSSIRRNGFLDDMYFTNFETKDWSIYDADLDGHDAAWAQNNCADKYWDARSTTAARNGGCSQIQFASDTLDGPVHSNDAILICNDAIFRKQITTAFIGNGTTTNHTYRTNNCSNPNTNRYPPAGTVFSPGVPRTTASVTMPATNVSLKSFTDATASPRGCLYSGPTKIIIKGSQIKVTSPWTKPASLPASCVLGSYFTIPTAGVVYVQNVPSDGTSDPNSWGAAEAGKPSCPASGTVNANNVGYPLNTEGGWTYPCRMGDVFIEEENGSVANALGGRLTVGAGNDLYITNNLDNLNGLNGSSMLGLIANGFIYYGHPVTSTAVNNGTCLGNNVTAANGGKSPTRVAASMVSVAHSIMTQSYCQGNSLGTLTMTGSMTQNYRGIVRRGSAGYAKDYHYDTRLGYDAPPHFLDPTISTFNPVTMTETTVNNHAG
jgi:Tfp pilus assembly protein PilX